MLHVIFFTGISPRTLRQTPCACMLYPYTQQAFCAYHILRVSHMIFFTGISPRTLCQTPCACMLYPYTQQAVCAYHILRVSHMIFFTGICHVSYERHTHITSYVSHLVLRVICFRSAKLFACIYLRSKYLVRNIYVNVAGICPVAPSTLSVSTLYTINVLCVTNFTGVCLVYSMLHTPISHRRQVPYWHYV